MSSISKEEQNSVVPAGCCFCNYTLQELQEIVPNTKEIGISFPHLTWVSMEKKFF